jgi:hypothetical protein
MGSGLTGETRAQAGTEPSHNRSDAGAGDRWLCQQLSLNEEFRDKSGMGMAVHHHPESANSGTQPVGTSFHYRQQTNEYVHSRPELGQMGRLI